MTKNLNKIENLTILIIAVFGIFISIFDIFGLLDLPKVQEKTSQIVLLLISILLGYVATFQQSRLSRIEKIVLSIEGKQIQNNINQFNEFEKLIDPTFKKIFLDKISESFHFIKTLIGSKSIVINDLSRFRFYYKSIIEENPKKIFLLQVYLLRIMFGT